MARAVSPPSIRFATEDDCGLLLQLIRELAALRKSARGGRRDRRRFARTRLRPERQFEALLAFVDGEPAGFALFHSRIFRPGAAGPALYLEDIYVSEWARGHGVGRRLMARLAAIAIERGWGRIDFTCSTGTRRAASTSGSASKRLDEWLRYGATDDALRPPRRAG